MTPGQRADESRSPPQVIAIVAGEPSGDKLGEGLIKALRTQFPTTRFCGIGGPRMAAAGCEILYDMDRIGVMGVDGLKDKLVDILKIRSSLASRWQQQPPTVFVGVDVPDFNLTLERKLKQCGIPCVHYVSPTVWAWRGYRIHKIRRAVSHMLTLFPFEADFYRRHEVPVTCVGHPIADEIGTLDGQSARRQLGLSPQVGQPGQELIALLPGSRRSEVSRLAKPMIDAARKLLITHPGLHFVVPLASDRMRELFVELVGDLTDMPILVLDGQARLALEASNLGIVASGTASLEAALLQVPHVAVYKLSAVSYRIMHWLRQVDHYAMPNHLLDHPILPELIQSAATPTNIAAVIADFLNQPQRADDLRQQFAAVHASLKLGADEQAAKVIARYLCPQPAAAT